MGGLNKVRVLLALTLVLVQAGHARAGRIDQREFVILVDGKEVGQSHLTISDQDDGSTLVNISASVKVNILLISYRYAVETQEVWKEGKLQRLQTLCTENGKKTEVRALAEGDKLRLAVNGKEGLIRPDVWTTSYWKLPDPRFHNNGVPLLDTDTGKEYAGQLKYIGTEQINVGNQPEKCYHFQITGAPHPMNMWFDRYHRIVRQDFVDSGHRTIIQLIHRK